MRISAKILALLLIARAASASINIETWSETENLQGWQITSALGDTVYGILDWESSVDGYSGVLRNTGGAVDAQPKEDLIFTTTGALASGADYSGGGLGIKFDFYAGAYLPQKLEVYLLGTGYQWFLNVTPDISLGWTSIYAPIYFGAGWDNADDRTASEFAADLTQVDAIGVRLWYAYTGDAQTPGEQIYGLDNFDVVPEPETWAFLGIAFLSIGYSFREKIDKAMADLMVRVRSC